MSARGLDKDTSATRPTEGKFCKKKFHVAPRKTICLLSTRSIDATLVIFEAARAAQTAFEPSRTTRKALRRSLAPCFPTPRPAPAGWALHPAAPASRNCRASPLWPGRSGDDRNDASSGQHALGGCNEAAQRERRRPQTTVLLGKRPRAGGGRRGQSWGEAPPPTCDGKNEGRGSAVERANAFSAAMVGNHRGQRAAARWEEGRKR